MDKLKNRWGIRSRRDFFMINLVFTLAGMTIIYQRKPIFQLLGITEHTPLWIKVAVYIPVVIPCYQLNLIIYGTLLGQFRFFWDKEKKLFGFLRGLVWRKKTGPRAD
jgi:hypothetical protein